MLELLKEIYNSYVTEIYNSYVTEICNSYVTDIANIRSFRLIMNIVLRVSKQHKVTAKYKMPAKTRFAVFCQSGEDIQKYRASRFCCRASVFFKSLVMQDK